MNPTSPKNTDTFEFGKNWQRFLSCVNEDRVRIATQSIRDFLDIDDLAGKSFLDIGCGSGLFSYAAHMLGAGPIVSFDIDPFSARCCKHWHQKAGCPSDWQVLEGSVLDGSFLRSIKPKTFDVVYAWGSLHHTGRMWDAIENASKFVADNGHFYLSIYNKKRGARGSNYWLKIKRFYNRRSALGKKTMERLNMLYYYQSKLVRLKNPWRKIREYQSKRGMDWRTDLVDWLGGYPYEFATVEEIFNFLRRLDPSFQLANLKATDDLGTSSFLFQKIATRAAAAPDAPDIVIKSQSGASQANLARQ